MLNTKNRQEKMEAVVIARKQVKNAELNLLNKMVAYYKAIGLNEKQIERLV